MGHRNWPFVQLEQVEVFRLGRYLANGPLTLILPSSNGGRQVLRT